MSKPKPRYESVGTGIRKDLWTNKFVAKKTIGGKPYSKSFKKLSEARKWRNEFHPQLKNQSRILTSHNDLNGKDLGYLFGDIWEKYKSQHLEGCELNTKRVTLERGERFYDELLDVPMVDFNPEFLDDYVLRKKEFAMTDPKSKRFSFDEEIKRLKALFNWYQENYDYKFRQPIKKRHKTLGKVKEKPRRDKKMSDREVLSFFDGFLEQHRMFEHLARVQFYLAGRISEPAGLTVDCVNFIKGFIELKYVSVWGGDKKFLTLKDSLKNGEDRFCYFPETLRQILIERVNSSILFEGKKFLFHKDGKPLGYRTIQYQYNKALKKAGLFPRFSSTHMVRHSMATITREVTESLDATQAVTGHRDQRVVDKIYSRIPSKAQRKAVNVVESHLSSLNEKSCDEVPCLELIHG